MCSAYGKKTLCQSLSLTGSMYQKKNKRVTNWLLTRSTTSLAPQASSWLLYEPIPTLAAILYP
jgi:hypothetical protein